MFSAAVTICFLLVTSIVTSEAARDVMVVTSTEEFDEPRVLEIYDFDTRSWRAIEKSKDPVPPGPQYRAESLKPGTARLVENHSVLQYELRNGISMELAR